jgi:hypothetical protein
MWRRILISLLVILVVGGAYVWFSLSPEDDVNLQSTVDVDALKDRLRAARDAQLPISLSGNEVKALFVEMIRSAKMDDRIQGVDVELLQDSMRVSLAVDSGAKVLAVSAKARPALTEGQLSIELQATKLGAIPVPVQQVLSRMQDVMPPGVSFSDGCLLVDMGQEVFHNLQISSLAVENGQLKLEQK